MKHFFLIIALFVCVSSFAQHNHGGGEEEHDKPFTPQHGGQIVETGKYKLEIVANPLQKEDKLLVYVLKKSYKELEVKEGDAKVSLKYKDGKTDTLTMQIHNGKFVTNDIDLTQPVNLVFEIRLGSKTITGTHFYEGLKKYNHEDH